MKRQQVMAVLLSAVLTVSASVPLGSISAFAADGGFSQDRVQAQEANVEESSSDEAVSEGIAGAADGESAFEAVEPAVDAEAAAGGAGAADGESAFEAVEPAFDAEAAASEDVFGEDEPSDSAEAVSVPEAVTETVPEAASAEFAEEVPPDGYQEVPAAAEEIPVGEAGEIPAAVDGEEESVSVPAAMEGENVEVRNLRAWAVGHEEEKDNSWQNLSDWEGGWDLQVGDTYRLQILAETADGSEPSFQWYRNHKLLEGETGSTFDALIYQASWNFYTCKVTDASGEQVEIFCQLYGNGDGDNYDYNLQAWVVGHEEEKGNNDQNIYDWEGAEGLRVGDSYTFQVEAETQDGSQPVYQWYSSYSGLIEGATSSSYDAVLAESNLFTCRVQDQYGNQVEICCYIDAEKVDNQLRIRMLGQDDMDFSEWNYADVSLTPGQAKDLTVEVSAEDTEGLTWQWYISGEDDWEPIEGAVTDTLSVTTAGNRKCVVTDKYWNTATCEFNIYVETHLTAYPEGTEPYEDGSYPVHKSIQDSPGSSETLKVIAQSQAGSLSYQWLDGDWNEIPGATGDTFTTNPIDRSCTYICRIRDDYNESSCYFFITVNNLVVEIEGEESGYSTKNIDLAPRETQTLKVFATADDTSRLSYKWTWEFYNERTGEVEYADLAEGPSADSCTADRQGTYICEITDGYGNTQWLYFYVSINHFKAYAAASEEGLNFLDIGIRPGEDFTMETALEADDKENITFNWFWQENDAYDYSLIEGADSAVYTARNVQPGQSYRCEVYDSYGNYACVYFSFKDMVVSPVGSPWPDNYYYDYSPVEVDKGSDVPLEVSVTPEGLEGLTYEWFLDPNGERRQIEGADTSACTVKWSEIEGAEGPVYVECIVTNQDGGQGRMGFEISLKQQEETTFDLKDAAVTVPGTFTYDGAEKTPDVQVVYDGRTLTAGTDYTVAYSDNTNAGTAKATVTGKGSYTGTAAAEFTIGKAAQTLAAEDLVLTYPESGKIAVTGAQGSLAFASGKTSIAAVDSDGIVAAKSVGTAQITVSAAETDNYLPGEIKVNVKVSAAPMSKAAITLEKTSFTYDGKAKTPAVTVKYNGIVLKEGTDYTAAYTANTNAGTAKAAVTGKGNYAGTKAASFTITKAGQKITAKASAATVAVGKTVTVTVTGAKGTKSFTSSNTAVATVTSAGKITAKKVGTVTITAKAAATANYNAGSATVTIKVVPAATESLTAANLTKGIKLTYKKVTGANGYIIYRNNTKIKTITNGSTVTYTDAAANTNGTKYVYKVVAKAATGTSPLSRSVTVYKVAQPAVKTLTNSASKKMTATWAKNAKATGYQIQYSTSKTFASGNKTVSINKAATVSKVIGNLTKGKTYYVRIRTCKTVGSIKYWSSWSAAKSVKISK